MSIAGSRADARDVPPLGGTVRAVAYPGFIDDRSLPDGDRPLPDRGSRRMRTTISVRSVSRRARHGHADVGTDRDPLHIGLVHDDLDHPDLDAVRPEDLASQPQVPESGQ